MTARGVSWRVLMALSGAAPGAGRRGCPRTGAGGLPGRRQSWRRSRRRTTSITRGVALARRAVAMAPDEPAAHRALAAMLWLHMLFRRGTVTVDHYLGGV